MPKIHHEDYQRLQPMPKAVTPVLLNPATQMPRMPAEAA